MTTRLFGVSLLASLALTGCGESGGAGDGAESAYAPPAASMANSSGAPAGMYQAAPPAQYAQPAPAGYPSQPQGLPQNFQHRGQPGPAAQPPGPGAQVDAASGQLPAGAYRVQPAKIPDGEMTAYSLFIPAGWQTQGQIVWQDHMAQCGPNGTHVNWMAASPDGSMVLHIFPEETWTGHNMGMMGTQQDCPNINLTSVRDYLGWYVQRNRPNARILEYRDRPDLIKDSLHLNETQLMDGAELHNRIQAGEVLIAYDLQGQAMRETIAVSVFFMHSRMPGAMGEVLEFLVIAAQPGLAVRAPAGKLDFQLVETVRSSIKVNPQWMAIMVDHDRKMSAIARQGAIDQHEIRMDALRTVGAINNQIFQDRQASNERIDHRFNQAIREVGTYTDPTTREAVELPHTHNNAWRLDDGTYVLTNDAGFQPYRDIGVDGRQLELKR